MTISRADRARILAKTLAGSPNQEEIDAVAHFVESVQELRASPFFTEEFRNLSIQFRAGAGKDDMHGRFSNPHVVAAVLIPFRRMWQKKEPCFFRRVANLLKKYEPQEIGWVDSFVFSDKMSNLSRWAFLEPEKLSPSEVIDLWLNTRYMHTGKSHRHGQFTRNEFDEHERRMGKDRFEYYFQVAVHEAAISFFNLGRCCEGFLLACEGRGLRPSFTLRQPLQESANRMTPGITVRGDSPPDRLWRLKRRERYGAVAKFLFLIDLSDERVSTDISRAKTFDELLPTLGVRIESRDESGIQCNETMPCVSSVTDSLMIVIRPLLYPEPSKYELIHGATPIFWWPLPLEFLKGVIFNQIQVSTIYNPSYLARKLRAIGMTVQFNQKKKAYTVTMEEAGRTRGVLLNLGYFTELIQRGLLAEDVVVEALRKAISEAEGRQPDSYQVVEIDLNHRFL